MRKNRGNIVTSHGRNSAPCEQVIDPPIYPQQAAIIFGETTRFLSQDPLAFLGNPYSGRQFYGAPNLDVLIERILIGSNVYQYCNSLPILEQDPSGLGCKVSFDCEKTDEQVDGVVRQCFYICKIRDIHLNAVKPNEPKSVDTEICDKFAKWKKERLSWPEERTHTGWTIDIGVVQLACPPASCDDPLAYAVAFQGYDRDNSNCTRKECRGACDAGTVIKDICEKLKSPYDKMCEISLGISKTVCYDMCNILCQDKQLPNDK